jgi:hypothetical protein
VTKTERLAAHPRTRQRHVVIVTGRDRYGAGEGGGGTRTYGHASPWSRHGSHRPRHRPHWQRGESGRTTWCTEPDSPSHEETGRRALAATKPLVCPFSMDLRVNSYPEYSGPTDFADAGTPGGGGALTEDDHAAKRGWVTARPWCVEGLSLALMRKSYSQGKIED